MRQSAGQQTCRNTIHHWLHAELTMLLAGERLHKHVTSLHRSIRFMKPAHEAMKLLKPLLLTDTPTLAVFSGQTMKSKISMLRVAMEL